MHFVVFIRFLDTKPRLIRTLSVPHQLWKVQEHICRSYGIGLIDVLHTFRLTRSNKKVQPLLCLRQMGNRIGSNISLGPAFKRHIEGNHNLCYKIPNTTKKINIQTLRRRHCWYPPPFHAFHWHPTTLKEPNCMYQQSALYIYICYYSALDQVMTATVQRDEANALNVFS